MGSTVGDNNSSIDYRDAETRKTFGSLNEAYYQNLFMFANI